MNDMQRQPIEAEAPGRFTVDEFMMIAEAFDRVGLPGKIELADGVLVRMSPMNNPHFQAQRQLFAHLFSIFGYRTSGIIVGQEPGIRLAEDTARAPDVAILRDPGEREGLIPGDHLVLAAEVSDTTLDDDKGPKRLSYARAGVPHYWVVDIRGRVLETWSDPAYGDYLQHRTIPFGDPIPVPGTNQTITLS